jgi:hypothetical protein
MIHALMDSNEYYFLPKFLRSGIRSIPVFLSMDDFKQVIGNII